MNICELTIISIHSLSSLSVVDRRVERSEDLSI